MNGCGRSARSEVPERGWTQISVPGTYKKRFWPESGLETGFCQPFERKHRVQKPFQNGTDGLSRLFVAGIVPEAIRTGLEEQSGDRQGLGNGETLIITDIWFESQNAGNTLDVIDLSGKSWCGASSIVVAISPWFALGGIQCGIKLGTPQPFEPVPQIQHPASIRSYLEQGLATVRSAARGIKGEIFPVG